MKTTAALFAALAGLWLACGALEAIAQVLPPLLVILPAVAALTAAAGFTINHIMEVLPCITKSTRPQPAAHTTT